jgi:hypothetical protein
MRKTLPWLALGQLLALSLACGTSGTTTDPATDPAAGITVRRVTYGTALGPNQQITTPVQIFQPTDPVSCSVEIAGRPSSGTVTLRWPVGPTEEATASVDLSNTNGGVLFSVGQTTYVGGTLSHTNPLPIGIYETIVQYNGTEVGRYPFEVGPPPGAIPSAVRSAQLARGHTETYQPIDPATTFGTQDTVHLTGCGAFGLMTWLQVDWQVAGTVDPAGTRSLTLRENVPDTCFAFEFRPAPPGWPPGAHTAVLTMNDREVGRYPFTVQ